MKIQKGFLIAQDKGANNVKGGEGHNWAKGRSSGCWECGGAEEVKEQEGGGELG